MCDLKNGRCSGVALCQCVISCLACVSLGVCWISQGIIRRWEIGIGIPRLRLWALLLFWFGSLRGTKEKSGTRVFDLEAGKVKSSSGKAMANVVNVQRFRLGLNVGITLFEFVY